MKLHIGAVAALLVCAIPAMAQDSFKPGQMVTSTDPDSRSDLVCTTKDDLKNYSASGLECAFGGVGGCNAVEDLENRKVCGVHYKSYVVVSVDGDLIQIAPAGDRSKTYWADPADFQPAP